MADLPPLNRHYYDPDEWDYELEQRAEAAAERRMPEEFPQSAYDALPPLVRSGPLRGVWLRIRHQPPAPPEVDVDFADRTAPPGPGWTWVDEAMANRRIEQPVGSGTPTPPDPQPDDTRLVDALWDPTRREWITDPTAGLAQLDTGDDPPNANVPTHETRPPT